MSRLRPYLPGIRYLAKKYKLQVTIDDESVTFKKDDRVLFFNDVALADCVDLTTYIATQIRDFANK